jgi:hypothetical protein
VFPPSLQVLLLKLTNAEDIEKTLRKQLGRKDQEIVALEGKYADLGAKHERVADDHHLTKETIAESNEHAVNLDKQILQKDEKIETLQKKAETVQTGPRGGHDGRREGETGAPRAATRGSKAALEGRQGDGLGDRQARDAEDNPRFNAILTQL